MSTKPERPFSASARLASFRFAFKGIVEFFRSQHNARIHLLCALGAVALGLWLEIAALQWCVVAFCIAAVFAAELVNTAIEYLTDLVSPGYNEKAGKVKDLAAAAVLVVSIAALICAAFIFLPPLLVKFGL